MLEDASAAYFPTTCWSRILEARDPAAPESRAALEGLCRDYWYPLYAFIRRKGHDPETAQDLVPRPLQANAAKPTRYGVIYFGSTAPAMDEAIGLLEARGHQLDRMRIRAFPFHSSVASFLAEHDFTFVVEQNRDGQLRSLIVNECNVDPVRLVPILHYDGTPITARYISSSIADHLDALKVTPLRKGKVKS